MSHPDEAISVTTAPHFNKIISVLSRTALKKLSGNVFAVGRSLNAKLNEEEVQAVHEVTTCSSGMVHPKVFVNRQLISSKNVTRAKKKNSYTVAFTDPRHPDQVLYGTVQRFATLCIDPDSSIHLAFMKTFQVDTCAVLEGLHYEPETQPFAQLLASDFVSIVSCHDSVTAVPVEHICLKCIDISTVGYRGLTTLINENEKDL